MSHLKRPAALTRAGMVAERLLRAFWPLWTVIALALAPLIAGWQDRLPVEAFWGWAVLAILGGLAGLGWGLWRFRWPSRAEALDRLDRSLPGRPVSALLDAQATGRGDSGAEALWAAHQERMRARSANAPAARPDLRLAARDPFGLRYIALLFLLTALLFGSVWRLGSVTALTPGGTDGLAQGPVWEGWIEPPAHTGQPALYLADQPPGALAVPENSEITVRLYGEIGALTLSETVSGRTGELPAASAPEQSFTVIRDGRIAIDGPGGAEWEVRAIPDAMPQVSVAGPLDTAGPGQMTLPFRASDDHGVVSGQASITLDVEAVERAHGLVAEPDPREALVVDLPMPFTGDRREIEEILAGDFSEHPFANMPVRITLEVTDAADQTGAAQPYPATLPGRRFFQPVARAVAEQRRDLLWSRDNAGRVVDLLRAVSHRPEEVFPDEATYLRLRVALRRLDTLRRAEGGLTVEAQDEIAKALWDLAVQLEDGTLADARERLRRAQERLAQAMRDGASPDEIAELMDELRAATDEYLRMLAENAQPAEDGLDEPQTGQGESMEITQDELQALMDRIQELMEEGRMAEAAELMEQLNRMMENLQVAQGEGSGPSTPGQRSMQDLQESLRDQQELSDEAFRELQDRFNGRSGQPQGPQGQPGQGQQGQQGQDQPGQGQPGEGDMPGPGSLADRQQALRDELARQRGALPRLDGDAARRAEEALDRAGRAMDGAEEALRRDDLAGAIDRQAEATEALRGAARELGEALAQGERGEPGEPGEGQRGDGAGQRDPLGRDTAGRGGAGTDDSMLEGTDPARRAEELLGEIRRRAAERERPRAERDYLERLLDLF
ncbi:TIGR02302 family protein [Limimaricola variabilis]|uniref:TIGR02302 family protein n=1 Tax=Limimaricola variabilis TaxID=1492771 RepID=UPI002AC9B5B6|nr:TIGR02302 family protein [Limimaricola variabilis]WPY96080.1 TIGR02302 family protein [Limimaricola variabilis]